MVVTTDYRILCRQQPLLDIKTIVAASKMTRHQKVELRTVRRPAYSNPTKGMIFGEEIIMIDAGIEPAIS